MSDLVKTAAENVAARVATRNVSIDPILIITVIQAIIGCLNRNDGVESDQMRSRVVQMNDRNPKRLQRRTVLNIKHEYRNKNESISNEDAEVLAEEMIQEMIQSPAEFADNCCAMALAKEEV